MTSAAGDARRSALSQHPVDLLIRELLRTGRPAATEEIAQIIDRMATAPFNPQDRRVPTKERGARYRGYTLGARADSLTYHLIKRVVIVMKGNGPMARPPSGT